MTVVGRKWRGKCAGTYKNSHDRHVISYIHIEVQLLFGFVVYMIDEWLCPNHVDPHLIQIRSFKQSQKDPNGSCIYQLWYSRA